MRPKLIALLVVGICLAQLARAASDKEQMPERVFKSFIAAIKEGEAKAAMAHLSRDSQSLVVGYMISYTASVEKSLFAVLKSKTAKEAKERAVTMDDVVTRHISFDDEARWKKLNEVINEVPRNEPRFCFAIGELVKDKLAFVTDMLKKDANQDLKTVGGLIGDLKVKDVKIDGQVAKGQLTYWTILPAKERTVAVHFKLEDGFWKIDVVETIESYANMPSAAEPPAQPQRQTPRYDSRPGLLRWLFPRLRNR